MGSAGKLSCFLSGRKNARREALELVKFVCRAASLLQQAAAPVVRFLLSRAQQRKLICRRPVEFSQNYQGLQHDWAWIPLDVRAWILSSWLTLSPLGTFP